MTEAMPFLQKAILLSYDPWPFRRGNIFFWLLPGSRSLSPSGEIPAGAPKNLPVCERGDFFWLLYCAIAIVRLCAHIIIIHNDIHARAEPAGILQKIRV